MTTNSTAIDTARVELLLTELRLPAIKQMWPKLAEHADKEGWPAARFLAALTELEIADRGRRPPRPPCDDPGDERQELSAQRSA